MLKKIKQNFILSFHYMKIAHEIDKLYIPILFFLSLVKACIPLINIIMPKYIIDEMITGQRTEVLFLLVLITIISNAILGFIHSFLNYIITIKNRKIINGFELHLGNRIMTMDFEKIEDPNILNLREKAIYPVKNQGVLDQMVNSIASCVQQFITILSLIILISTLNFYVLLFLMLFVFINVYINQRNQKAENEFIMSIVQDNREMGYYRGLTNDFSTGKDIRLYNMQPLILSKIREYIERSTLLFKRLMSKTGLWTGVSNISLQLQLSVIYGYITYEVIVKRITIGSFMMYINVAINFCTALYSLLQSIVQFQQMCKFLFPYREFEEVCTPVFNGAKSRIKSEENWCIEFKNVYFKYPRSDNYVLEDISIKILPGEKLSIIGMNGAGKTTFIKLLCRLYRPTKGEITLNGINIIEYDSNEYLKYINCIFQDFKLFAFTIGENIAMDDKWDDNNVYEVLNNVGLKEKVCAMEKSLHSSLYKLFDKDGVELSGGQYQKLAIARALYREAKIIIMDEPTASLDPIAEYEIFNNLNGLAKNKTTIFISHRLSSCRFCDKIAVFDQGHIIQYGSHDELICNQEGKYFELFTAQAKYYHVN